MTTVAPEPPRQARAWEVMPLGRTAWRICDSSLTESDPSRLIAYVDRNEAGMFDVLWLLSPCPTRSRYRDLEAILTDLDTARTRAAP